jgi:hypothetical protein
VKHIKFAFLVPLFLFLVTACSPKQNIAEQRAAVEPSLVQAYGRISTAETEVSTKSPEYPAYYSQPLIQQLQSSKLKLESAVRPNTGLLAQLTTAQNNSDWKKAQDLLDQLKNIQNTDVATVNRILGPPDHPEQAFYTLLQQKVQLYKDGYVLTDSKNLMQEVSAMVDSTKAVITNTASFALCGDPSHQMTFRDAWAMYYQAVGKLTEVNATLTTRIDGMIDTPKATDQLVEIYQTFNTATTSAVGAAGQNQQTIDSINSATTTVNAVSAYIMLHPNLGAALQLSSAESYLKTAYTSCYAEDFAGAQDSARTAASGATTAQAMATPDDDDDDTTVVTTNTSSPTVDESTTTVDIEEDQPADNYVNDTQPEDNYSNDTEPLDDYSNETEQTDNYSDDTAPTDDYSGD